jgi:hypothetical protein
MRPVVTRSPQLPLTRLSTPPGKHQRGLVYAPTDQPLLKSGDIMTSADHPDPPPDAPLDAPPDAPSRLGQELQRLRKSGGQTLREFAATAGLSAHSNLVDYEKGRRVPPRDIVRVYEQVGQTPDGSLDSLHAEAMAAIGGRAGGVFHPRQPNEGSPDSPDPPENPANRRSKTSLPGGRRRLRRPAVVALAVGVILALAGGGFALTLGLGQSTGSDRRAAPAPTRRIYRQGDLRGPVDIGAACRAQWGARFQARLLDDHNAYTWRCVAPGEAITASSGVELKVQCLAQYGSNTTAVALQASLPGSWRCVQVTSGP